MKISSKLSISLVLTVSGFAIFLVISYYATVRTAKNSDECYQYIMNSKDMVADILPPPLYILEEYTTCYQIYFERDQFKIRSLEDKLIGLKKDYTERHEFWNKEESDPKVRKLLLEDSYKPAADFFRIVESEYIPSIDTNNKQLAFNILEKKLMPTYQLHREIIDELVTYSNAKNSEIIETNNRAIHDSLNNSLFIIITTAFVLLGVIIIYTIYLTRTIVHPLRRLLKITNLIAKGKLDSIN
jgi:methyl-accepting chemotaxis protein